MIHLVIRSIFGAEYVLAVLALRCLSLILILAGIPFCLIQFIFGYSCLTEISPIFECQRRIILLYFMYLFLWVSVAVFRLYRLKILITTTKVVILVFKSIDSLVHPFGYIEPFYNVHILRCPSPVCVYDQSFFFLLGSVSESIVFLLYIKNFLEFFPSQRLQITHKWSFIIFVLCCCLPMVYVEHALGLKVVAIKWV